MSKLVQEWIKPVQEDVVWICHLPRSGGTLLLRLLDSHPEVHAYPAVFSFPETNRIWPSGYVLSYKTFDNMSLEKFHLKGLRKQSSNMKRDIYPIYFDREWNSEIFWLSLKKETDRDYFNAFFTALFNAWRNNQNLYGDKKYVVGQMTLRKPELYRQNFDNFKQTYPNGKMVFLVRKPDDWLASALALKHSTPFTGDPYEAIEYYKVILRQVVEMKEDDSFVVFRFEDLIKFSTITMLWLAHKLGIKFTETLVRPTLNGAPCYQNSSFERTRKACIDRDVLGKGQRLPNEVLAAIDDECMELWERVNKPL